MRTVPVRSLAHVGVGETVSVVDVPGVAAVSLRLLEMGLTPGAAVAVVAVAPLGDPLELEVRGYRLSIRRREAALVTVAT